MDALEQGSLRRRKGTVDRSGGRIDNWCFTVLFAGNEDVEMTSSPSSSLSSSDSTPHAPTPLKADDKNHAYHDSLSTIAEEPTVKRM